MHPAKQGSAASPRKRDSCHAAAESPTINASSNSIPADKERVQALPMKTSGTQQCTHAPAGDQQHAHLWPADLGCSAVDALTPLPQPIPHCLLSCPSLQIALARLQARRRALGVAAAARPEAAPGRGARLRGATPDWRWAAGKAMGARIRDQRCAAAAPGHVAALSAWLSCKAFKTNLHACGTTAH